MNSTLIMNLHVTISIFMHHIHIYLELARDVGNTFSLEKGRVWKQKKKNPKKERKKGKNGKFFFE